MFDAKPYKMPMNDKERLQFAVRFAQTDLPTEEQGWFKLHDELCEFLKPTQRVVLAFSTKDLLAKEEMRSLQKVSYEMLADTVHARDDSLFEGKSSSEPISIHASIIERKVQIFGPLKCITRRK